MSPKQLLAYFDRIVEAPGAVPRLRRFILDLAVRGKLVEQDAHDEPVEALLQRIAAHRASAGVRSSNQPVPDRSDRGSLWQIPPSWEWVQFGTIVVSRDAERIPVSREERSIRAKLYDYYGASGVIDKIDAYLFEKPLLLIGEDGANLLNRSTPIAFIASGKYWVNNHAHVLDGISESFLRYLELHINAINLGPYVTGTAQPKMNQAKMNRIPIALPPLGEQQRIVAKVGELMALCDQLEAAQAECKRRRSVCFARSLRGLLNQPSREGARFSLLDHLARLIKEPEQLGSLRESILQLATRGRLIPTSSGKPSSSQASSEPSAPKAVPFSVPESWKWVSVDAVSQSRLGKMLDKARNKGTRKRYLRNVNVRWFDFNLVDVFEMPFEDSELKEFSLLPGDVLVCEGGEPGRAAVWDGREQDIYFQKAIHRLRFGPALDPHFFVLALRESFDSGRLAAHYTGVAIRHLTGRGLASLIVPLPPLIEQRLIVAKVEELLSVADRLETQLNAEREGRSRLLESVLQRALEGVGQQPTGEAHAAFSRA